jgi:flagellar biosynthesis protein FliR
LQTIEARSEKGHHLMRFVGKLVVGIALGFVAHWLAYEPTKKTALPEPFRYGVGVLVTLPVFSLLLHGRRRDEQDTTPELTFVVAFVVVGVGTLLGRFVRMTLGK